MRPLIAGNWKMHGMQLQLGGIQAIADIVKERPPYADIMICPPSTLIARAAEIAADLVTIGGQDCHAEIARPFTGDVSAQMLKDAGTSAVIVGHSERRQHHGETDAGVAAMAKAAWQAGLLAIICIGETDAQRRDGKALVVCANQIAGSVPLGTNAFAAAIAYEPLWAIGTGCTPTLEEIAEMHAHIWHNLGTLLGADGKNIRIIYGGSVKSSNAHEILTLAEVGGALVGGASLKAEEFTAIFGATSSQA